MQTDDPVKLSTASLARLGSLIAPFSSIKRALWLLNALCCSLPGGPRRERPEPGSATLAPAMMISAKATTVGTGPADSRNCPRIQAKKARWLDEALQSRS
jgi:hypothetical protein